jgi:hypothetical protein
MNLKEIQMIKILGCVLLLFVAIIVIAEMGIWIIVVLLSIPWIFGVMVLYQYIFSEPKIKS